MKLMIPFVAVALWALTTIPGSDARLADQDKNRDLVYVGLGGGPPGDDPRGEFPESCEEISDSGYDPMVHDDLDAYFCGDGDEYFCVWYPGYKEYYCYCELNNPDCDPENGSHCVDGFVNTRLDVNKGRQFWNCKDGNVVAPPGHPAGDDPLGP